MFVRCQLLSELCINRLQTFTMAAPRSVNLQHHIFVILENQIFEVFADDNLHRLIIRLWDGLRLQGLLNLASLNIIEESSQLLRNVFLSFRKHKSSSLTQSEHHTWKSRQTQPTLGMTAESASVQPNKAVILAETFGSLAEFFRMCFEIIFRTGKPDNFLFTSLVSGVVFTINWTEKRKFLFLNPIPQLVRVARNFCGCAVFVRSVYSQFVFRSGIDNRHELRGHPQ
mmetsp:Transcript_678/g.772  ORF Transcript_678/g.772 Transcript_678/m.772 type:complete len:227 (-) Transcript_678:555-1235(-)